MSERIARPSHAQDGRAGDRPAGTGARAHAAAGTWPHAVAAPVCLALVQHANQFLITDGYDNREGISELLDAFTGIFALHLRYRIPLNLHLAGTLLEAIAWHRPVFFEWVRALRREGLLELIGSAHAQNILPLFGEAHNRRQLEEHLRAYHRFLGVAPAEVRVFWLPERVWDTRRLAPLLRSPSLPNGGYRAVLLDDRLAYRSGGGSAAGERARFDRGLPPLLGQADGAATDEPSAADDAHRHPFRIDGGGGLIALPISTALRYAIPPGDGARWDALHQELRRTARADPDALAIFADDLERAAAVGPWTSCGWRPEALAPYRRLLEWLAREPTVRPIHLSSWLASHPVRACRSAEPGTYIELARCMKAGETYAAWWHDPEWRPYRKLLRQAEALLRRTPPGPRVGLRELAWRQLMAASAETAWHEPGDDGAPRLAPWVRAAAAHARSVFVIAAAARWLEQRDGGVHLARCDIDRDGRDEVVLRNDRLFAVLTPDYGGRLVYLFDLTRPGGRLVVGNPTDDWNWQEEANRFMEAPRNHPGAFVDVGHENEPYDIEWLECDGSAAEVRLVNRAEGALAGAVKAFRLGAGSGALEARYRLPEPAGPLPIEFCLSPDYLALLREGRAGLRPLRGRTRRGWRMGETAAWIAIAPGDPVTWDAPRQPECGHGLMLCATAYRPDFRLRLGVGAGPARARERPAAGPAAGA